MESQQTKERVQDTNTLVNTNIDQKISTTEDNIKGASDKDLTQVFNEAQEIEQHVHNVGHIFPQTTDSNGNEVADYTSLVNVQSDAVSSNKFGSWEEIASAADISDIDYPYFDPHELLIVDADTSEQYNIQIGYGDGSSNGTTVIGNAQLAVGTNFTSEREIPVQCIRIQNDGVSNLYVRTSCSTGGNSFDCNLNIHAYPPLPVVIAP